MVLGSEKGMKFHVLSPDLHGRIDGTVQGTVLNFLPNQVSAHEADIFILPTSYYEDFQWNPRVPEIIGDKPYVIIDYIELGLDWDVNGLEDSMILGRNVLNYSRVARGGWLEFNAFVSHKKPLVYFKRELLKKEVTSWLQPLDFPTLLTIPELQTRSEYESRPLEVLWFWGLSHESRPRLHGEIFRHAYSEGYEVLSQFQHWTPFFADPRGKVWASIHSPHFDRKPIQDVMHFNHRSKLSVSLPGAGCLCFRDNEVICGSLPVYWHMPIARAFPWEHQVNYLTIRPKHEWEDLMEATQRDDLYEIYCASQENAHNYTSGNYMNNHILPAIQKRL